MLTEPFIWIFQGTKKRKIKVSKNRKHEQGKFSKKNSSMKDKLIPPKTSTRREENYETENMDSPRSKKKKRPEKKYKNHNYKRKLYDDVMNVYMKQRGKIHRGNKKVKEVREDVDNLTKNIKKVTKQKQEDRGRFDRLPKDEFYDYYPYFYNDDYYY